MRIVATRLDPRRIFNLCDPAYLPELIRDWPGRLEFWHQRYDQLRLLIRAAYVQEFNAANGHYNRLRDSLLTDGMRAPVMLNLGWLQVRHPTELPPGFDAMRPVCEYLGGSRLLIAAADPENFPTVPCIVNDATDTLEGDVLKTVGDVVAQFPEPPRVAKVADGAAYVNDVPYHHMPDGYTLPKQSAVRRGVLKKVRAVVDDWLAEHD